MTLSIEMIYFLLLSVERSSFLDNWGFILELKPTFHTVLKNPDHIKNRGSPLHLQETEYFVFARNLNSGVISEYKNNFNCCITNKIFACSIGSKLFWSFVKSINQNFGKSSFTPLISDEEYTSTPKAKATQFTSNATPVIYKNVFLNLHFHSSFKNIIRQRHVAGRLEVSSSAACTSKWPPDPSNYGLILQLPVCFKVMVIINSNVLKCLEIPTMKDPPLISHLSPPARVGLWRSSVSHNLILMIFQKQFIDCGRQVFFTSFSVSVFSKTMYLNF